LLSVASKSPRKGAPYADENSLGAKTSNFPTSQLGLPKIQVEHQNQNGCLITPNHLRWFLTLATAGQSNPTTNGMGIQLWDHQGACAHACDTEIDGGVCSCMWYRDWWGACAHPYIWYGEIASFSLFFLYPHENNIFFTPSILHSCSFLLIVFKIKIIVHRTEVWSIVYMFLEKERIAQFHDINGDKQNMACCSFLYQVGLLN
jgi:hypothetical protein